MSPRLFVHNTCVEMQKGETVLAALRRGGFPMLYSCEEGYCHACILRTCSPVPALAQKGLSAELISQGAFLACRLVPLHNLRLYFPGEPYPKYPNTAVVILAGGKSSRMGKPKETVLFQHGLTMLDHLLDSLGPIGSPLFLSTTASPTEFQINSNLQLIPDVLKDQGPLIAVARILKFLAEKHPHLTGAVIVSCDQPLLTTSLMEQFFNSGLLSKPTFLKLEEGDSLAPFPGYFPIASLPKINLAIDAGERSPKKWASNQDCDYLAISSSCELQLKSINTPDDLSKACQILEGQSR